MSVNTESWFIFIPFKLLNYYVSMSHTGQILSSLLKAAVHQQRTAPEADSQPASHGHRVSYNPAS